MTKKGSIEAQHATRHDVLEFSFVVMARLDRAIHAASMKR
jgi:hypothetical protein